VKKVSLVLVTGDRGLCGSYNSAVIKAATKRIVKLTEQGIQVSFIDKSVVGDKLINKYNYMTCLFIIIIIIIDSIGSSRKER
jgi:F-type H+-transporting ATPase subunit gamma